MSYEVSWAVSRRVIHIQVSGHISFNEIEAVRQECQGYIKQAVQPVHVLVDASSVTHYPHDLRWLTRISSSPASIDGWSLIVVNSHELRYFMDKILSLSRKKFRLFQSFTEAQDFLSKQDPTVIHSDT